MKKVTAEDVPFGLTFDDVLLVPRRSMVRSRKDVSVATRLTKRISLRTPIVSSNMDTVTEDTMAVAMARNGGIGILHRFATVDEQCAMVKRVKRAQMFKIEDPFWISDAATWLEVKAELESRGVSRLVVYKGDPSERRVAGIVSRRDLLFANQSDLVRDMMTPWDRLIVARDANISTKQAQIILHQHKTSVLPVVGEDERLLFMITATDISALQKMPDALVDSKGRLMVGAAVGVKAEDMDRARALVQAGADVLVIDIAHGHSDLAINMTRKLKSDPIAGQVDVIVGNICTAEGARDLIAAGADALKVGVGPGSICITRKVAGSGFPQLSALWEIAPIAKASGVPVIADGGIRISGDIAKALAAGADTVMLGNLLSGTDESPGQVLTKDGKKVKIIRGMAGYGANISKGERERLAQSKASVEGRGSDEADAFDLVPEGVEAIVSYKGPVKDIIKQLVGGLKSGISYCGATNINQMYANAQWVRVTHSGLVESGAHDVSKL